MEILASLDDINAELPSGEDQPVVVATDDNTELLQISVARIVRGNLSRLLDVATLVGWSVPTKTPELIRVAAAKLIAAQLYFNNTARTTPTIDRDSFAQKRYDEAMAIINGVIAGSLDLIDVTTETPEDTMSTLDFFPVDATDRAFTRGMNL